MNNLYLINKLIDEALYSDQYIDHETGEIVGDSIARLESLGLQREQIIDEMIKEHKNLQFLVDGYDAEIKRLKDRQEKAIKTQNQIIKQIRPHLIEGEKKVTPEYELKWTTSTKVDGLDSFDPELAYLTGDIDKKFIKYEEKRVYSFDKKSIQEELKKESPNLPTDIFINKTKNIKIK